MKKIFFFFCILITGLTAKSQYRQDSLTFKDRIQPISAQSFFNQEGYYVWCPSVIKGKEGKYHLFYSRWKKKYKWSGWLTHCEVAHAVSDNAYGPWTYVETVLKSRGKGHWDAITVHNPKIKYFDGKYYIYYISTHLDNRDYTDDELINIANNTPGGPKKNPLRMNQRTGVAVSNNLSGPWKRFDKPLIEPSGPIANITVNPAITQGKDGRYYLIVKGDKPNESRFIRNQALAISNSPTGPFIMQPKPVIDYMDTEDMSIWYDKKRDYYYGVFHSTKKFIGMVSSPDGINWYKANDSVLVPNKELKRVYGTMYAPSQMERPFVFVENDEPKVLCVAVTDKGNSSLLFVKIAAR